MKFKLSADKKNAESTALAREWKDRAKAMREKIASDMADAGLKELLAKIPVSADYVDYRKSLEVVEVTGGEKNKTTFAIRSDPKYRRVRSVDVETTALYIRPRRFLKKISPGIKVLVDFSPWTPESLPFMPKRSEALVIYRKVSKKEVARIARSRKLDKHKWSGQLEAHGIRATASRDKKLPTGIKGVSDTAFTAMRLEFGIGGHGVAHWRPMARNLMGDGGKRILKHPSIFSALADPKFEQWKKWPGKRRKRIFEKDLKDLVQFQKKLFKG